MPKILLPATNTYLNVLYDSLYSSFSFPVFIWQLILHLTFPILLPVVLWRHGFTAFYAQQFIVTYKDTGLLNFSYPLPVCTTIIIVLAATSSNSFSWTLRTYSLVPIMLYFLHRVSISLKYATLTRTEYR
jgi:hypothetical protein